MKNILEKIKTDSRLRWGLLAVLLVVILTIGFLRSKAGKDAKIEIQKKQEKEVADRVSYSAEFPDLEKEKQEVLTPGEVSPISGLKCNPGENRNRRPIGVMLAGDKGVRPLSGTGEADMVFEMPVITASITRLMAVFVCNSPKEIGSIRSARHDYIALAKGLDAMLAHWGGSHFALEMLKNKETAPDLDAMRNEGGAFFRKAGILPPDNGFAEYDKLLATAKTLGYRTENHFEGYVHRAESAVSDRGKGGRLIVGFPGVYRVEYAYDAKTNSYLREWDGKVDLDRNTNTQVAPKNVVVIFATSRQIEGQYNDVDIEGSGEMRAFIEGHEFKGTWEKKKGNCVIGNELVCVNSAKLTFLKEDGKELEFVPGQIWVEVLEPGQKLKWTPEG